MPGAFFGLGCLLPFQSGPLNVSGAETSVSSSNRARRVWEWMLTHSKPEGIGLLRYPTQTPSGSADLFVLHGDGLELELVPPAVRSIRGGPLWFVLHGSYACHYERGYWMRGEVA
ncbi:hypothetical protein AXG93_406s1260 [Marchantia polymorpha subsp. ruderalis]|uniref:Uncharacterized protein n=1 Tax=Marchantia polymorpha subsp. ruderalis TaxID=1480154 RepID=A0A176VB91_MARPO|nr:hypothetical protein AXG93_406s1260 [Marchantia polymorpha subsp. ruderalis]